MIFEIIYVQIFDDFLASLMKPFDESEAAPRRSLDDEEGSLMPQFQVSLRGPAGWQELDVSHRKGPAVSTPVAGT